MEKYQQYKAALGQIGIAVQILLGGKIEDNAPEIFEIISEHPGCSAEEAASLIKSQRQRDSSGKVFSGKLGNKCIAPVLQGSVIQNDNGEFEIHGIDFDDPLSIIEAKEIENNIDFHDADCKNLELKFDQLEAAENEDWRDIMEQNKCSRREAFYIKSKLIASLTAEIEFLKARIIAKAKGENQPKHQEFVQVQAELFA